MFLRRFASTSTRTLPPTIRQLLSSPPPSAVTGISVNGWVKSIRRQKNVTFAVVTDGSSTQGLQAVLTDGELSRRLTNGTSVRFNGRLVDSPGKGQAKELQVQSGEVWSQCDPEAYPIQKQSLTVEYLRDHSHLRARTDGIASMLRLRDSALRHLHRYFEDQGFCYIHTPILTSSDAEGAGETFQIHKGSASSVSHSIADTGGHVGLDGRVNATEEEDHFFSKPAFLTVSSQLHLEALANSISRVYTLSPCFRAERSQTNRHLAEFWMLEAEWAFTTRLEDIMGLIEDSLRPLARMTLSEYPSFWNESNDAKRQVLTDAGSAASPWARMTYTEAIAELSKQHSISREFEFEPVWGCSLQSEHERWLSEKLIRGPVFVTDYPTSLKPFYMRANDDGKTVACFDLLVPYLGELVGGSLREERLDLLQQALDVHKMDGKNYAWYLDLRKYGGAPHGGYGMGFERLISWLSGIDNVRECIPMPRWAGRMLL